jgi:3-hydroxyacyl-CoA dehydrogenase
MTTASQIRTVAVIGCGVIGSSWASLFLSRGLKVVIYDPQEGVEEAFKKYLHNAWPTLQASGALENASAENYEFVDDIVPSLSEVDFVQEVRHVRCAIEPS